MTHAALTCLAQSTTIVAPTAAVLQYYGLKPLGALTYFAECSGHFLACMVRQNTKEQDMPSKMLGGLTAGVIKYNFIDSFMPGNTVTLVRSASGAYNNFACQMQNEVKEYSGNANSSVFPYVYQAFVEGFERLAIIPLVSTLFGATVSFESTLKGTAKGVLAGSLISLFAHTLYPLALDTIDSIAENSTVDELLTWIAGNQADIIHDVL